MAQEDYRDASILNLAGLYAISQTPSHEKILERNIARDDEAAMRAAVVQLETQEFELNSRKRSRELADQMLGVELGDLRREIVEDLRPSNRELEYGNEELKMHLSILSTENQEL